MGTKIPRCPGEVFELLKRNHYQVPKNSEERKNEYIQGQNKINKAMSLFLNKKENLPPCCSCKSEILCYCEDNEIICKTFEMYTSSGKC